MGSVARNSQVFVPAHPAFHSIDFARQGPATVEGKRTLETYPSPGQVAPANENYLVVCYVWGLRLQEFLTRSAFQPLPYAAW
jgi:hypothetical protein